MKTIKQWQEYCQLNARNIIVGRSKLSGQRVVIGLGKDYNTGVR